MPAKLFDKLKSEILYKSSDFVIILLKNLFEKRS